MVSTDAAQYVAPFVTPLAGLWVIHNASFSSAGFVNKMRETMVSGVYEKENLTREHAKAFLSEVVAALRVERVRRVAHQASA